MKTHFFKYLQPLIILALFTGTTHAAVQDRMEEIFNVMTSTAPAGLYQGQLRNSLSAGGLRVRARTVNPALIGFTPPQLNAGCNGIDIFGGSFSFINAAQFEALLRNIASNAAGYAFSLAIEAICPTCSAIMQKLSDKVNELNQMMTNSCEVATKLVNMTGIKDWHDAELEKDNAGLVDLGFVEDWFDAKEGDGRGNRSEKANTAGNADEKEINIVWAAMEKSGITANFRAGDAEMREVLMSLIGTYTASCGQAGGVCSEADFTYTYLKPTLSLKTFLYGSSGEEANTVELYDCGADVVNCADPTLTNVALKGFYEYVNDLLLGDGASIGIAAKLPSKNEVYTAEEQGFIEAARVPILTLMRRVSYTPGATRTLASEASEVVAIDVATAMVENMVKHARSMLRGELTDEAQLMLEAVSDVLNDIQAEREQLSGLKQAVLGVYNLGDIMQRQAPEQLEAALSSLPSQNTNSKGQ